MGIACDSRGMRSIIRTYSQHDDGDVRYNTIKPRSNNEKISRLIALLFCHARTPMNHIDSPAHTPPNSQ
jgi:hypothetical protein